VSAGPGVARALAAHWPLWAVCALFLLTGALALDDYGAWIDTWPQRAIGNAALDYLAGDGERAFDQLHLPWDRYYGAAFEAPLVLLLERILGLEHGRDVYLSRHLLTHLFFLASGVFCYLLVLRMFNSRALALVAVALFLLHPRLYAHSFFNSKDIPFLAAFMIALCLTHRAFRRDTLGAFLLCGVGVGLLINLRIMGVVLFAAVLALRALDLALAGSADGRKRVLLTGGAFALAAVLTLHASLPVLWADPAGQLAEWARTLSGDHPNAIYWLFRGEWLYSQDTPPLDYVPVWVGITTPPATLLLAFVGAVALAWRCLRRPRGVIRNGPSRFGLLLVALPVATVTAIVALESNPYDHWRHLYFLYAPLLLLAVFGLRGIMALAKGPWPRTGAYVLAGAAIAIAVVAMVRIHPYQSSYFNVLTDRSGPDVLISRYGTGIYRIMASGRALRDILNDRPSGAFFVALASREPRPHWSFLLLEYLRPEERKRLTFTRDFRSGEPNLLVHVPSCAAPFPVSSDPRRLYGATISCVTDPGAWFGGYRRAALATEPLVRSRFDVHRAGDVLVYLRDGCSPDDMDARFFLRIHPIEPAALFDRPWEVPAERAAYGFENRDFDFTWHGARIDGDCVAVVPLPDYPIARIETGQFTPERAEAALRAVAGGEPRARSRFDVWLDADGRGLIYVRDDCATEDVEARFFLHAWPVDERDLFERRAEYGFNNLDFDFPEYGVRTGDGGCIATVPLPAYPIANTHTGQFTGEDTLWSVRFALTPPEVEPAALAGEPLARSLFDVHLHGDALVYVRDGCTDEDAGTAFFLHVVPIDPGDLPDDRGQYGFDNLDFFLWERGARDGDRCVAVVPLPDYPIASVRTGQYDGTGALWTADFALPDGQ